MYRLLCSVFPFLVHGYRVLARINTHLHAIVRHSARRISTFFFGSCNDVDIIREAYGFFCHLTAIVPMKPSNAFVLVCSKTIVEKEWRHVCYRLTCMLLRNFA